MRRVSMATRDELLAAVAARYRSSPRADRARILDEFTAVTGYHRKHAMRLLRTSPSEPVAARQPRRLYDEAVRAALILLWEASDRICGKRLKALIPTLVPAMERHGHLVLAPEIRAQLLAISAANDRPGAEAPARASRCSRPAARFPFNDPALDSGAHLRRLGRSAARL